MVWKNVLTQTNDSKGRNLRDLGSQLGRSFGAVRAQKRLALSVCFRNLCEHFLFVTIIGESSGYRHLDMGRNAGYPSARGTVRPNKELSHTSCVIFKHPNFISVKTRFIFKSILYVNLPFTYKPKLFFAWFKFSKNATVRLYLVLSRT